MKFGRRKRGRVASGEWSDGVVRTGEKKGPSLSGAS